MALKWFEPNLLSDELNSHLDWMDNYSKFMLELHTNFRPHDPSGDAEMQLDVRNHNSVGVKRPYLHELSFDHLHYGVAWHFPV
jgi:hypothetical protein